MILNNNIYYTIMRPKKPYSVFFSYKSTLIFKAAILIISSFFFFTLTVNSQRVSNQAVDQNSPLISFENRNLDLGKVKRGDKINFSYVFTNTGKEDLQIDFVSGCDCTELDWPVKIFKPGDSGKIDVIFFSDKKEKSEIVEIDVLLKNTNPKTGNPIFEILSYTYIF